MFTLALSSPWRRSEYPDRNVYKDKPVSSHAGIRELLPFLMYSNTLIVITLILCMHVSIHTYHHHCVSTIEARSGEVIIEVACLKPWKSIELVLWPLPHVAIDVVKPKGIGRKHVDALHKGSGTLPHKECYMHASSQVQNLLCVQYVCLYTHMHMYVFTHVTQHPPSNSTVISGVNTTCYIVWMRAHSGDGYHGYDQGDNRQMEWVFEYTSKWWHQKESNCH